jgi:hypothetical protein
MQLRIVVAYRTKSAAQITALLVASALLLALLRKGGPDAWSQSPVSTVAPSISPMLTDISPGFSPVDRGVSPIDPGADQPVFTPTRTPGAFSRLFNAQLWSSPLPWIAVGVVLFGALAWALVAVLSRFQAGK